MSVALVGSLEFGDGHCLNRGESLARAGIEIAADLVAIQAMKQFPAGVGRVEEWLAVLLNQEPVIGADLETRERLRSGSRAGQCAGDRCTHEEFLHARPDYAGGRAGILRMKPKFPRKVPQAHHPAGFRWVVSKAGWVRAGVPFAAVFPRRDPHNAAEASPK